MRKIIHIDMDCFFAAVEMRDDPSLRNIPIAIAGRSERSVVSTCNYPAREYGVRSAMSVKKALQLCPHLTLVPSRMAQYQQASQKIREIFSRYTQIIEPLSLDEAFLDVSDSILCNGSATRIAQKIRQDIFNELQLTASAGVAPNKFLAKIASDENKPDGQCVIAPNQVELFVEHLPLKKIPGVGPKTLQKLNRKGFNTCADVRASDIKTLVRQFGKFGTSLYRRAHGIDDRQVETERERKSLAIETTLMEDIESFEQCMHVVEKLLPKFKERLSKVEDRQIKTQGVKVKFDDFSQTTVENSCDEFQQGMLATQLSKALERGEGKKVRLIGLHMGFKSQQVVQVNEPQLSFDLK
ncbi:DNA polymerase IV [Thalassotalea sp. Y01]|uniref:DNA polymerase IV n=1 Tax=Thalassotalea sp. Y01 TaxID=2729613 RepID=UPI00145CD93D|nr:DNA polymerase IV [Thalassotalea sp. Y01]NMP17399.1 DNA polymerase IV [Thalassotalea sp. Y01]